VSVVTLHPYFGALHDVIVPHDQFQSDTVLAGDDELSAPDKQAEDPVGSVSCGVDVLPGPQLLGLIKSVVVVLILDIVLLQVSVKRVSTDLTPVETLPEVSPPVEGLAPKLATIEHVSACIDVQKRVAAEPCVVADGVT
jgi:hypothetical protein